MKQFQIKVLDPNKIELKTQGDDQDQFNERSQIQEIRFALKKLYFTKRKLIAETLLDISQEDHKPLQEIQQLLLPDDIQKQREKYLTIQQKLKKCKSIQDPNKDAFIQQDQPFSKVKQKIFRKYQLKRKLIEQVKQKDVIEDSLQVQRKIVLDVYKNKLKLFHQNHAKSEQQKNIELPQQFNDGYSENTNIFRKQRKIQKKFNLENNFESLQKKQYNAFSKIQEEYDQPIKIQQVSKDLQESIVLQRHKNPNLPELIKANNKEMDLNKLKRQKISQNFHQQINESVEKNKKIYSKGEQKKIKKSFQEGGYKSFLFQQKRQLEEQKNRMLKLTEKAKNAINNRNFSDSQDQIEEEKKEFTAINEEKTVKQDQISFGQPIKLINEIKCLFTELIEQFIQSEVLKFYLQNRTYEMITKLFKNASTYQNNKIQIQDPISITSFSTAVKILLKDKCESNRELDLVINNIFQGKNQISFQEINQQFKSLINKKEIAMFEAIESKNQLDRTIEKTKQLFLIWISMNYFDQKIKQILKKNQLIPATIMKQCSTSQESQKFDIGLVAEFLYEGCNSHIQKRKAEIFLGNILGKQLNKRNFISWYAYSNQKFVKNKRQ